VAEGSSRSARTRTAVTFALVASVAAGAAIFFLGARLDYIGGGDEGRWQPYEATAAALWAALVFAFVFATTRRVATAAVTAVVAGSLAIVASFVTLGVLIGIAGGE
jgi:hypothetical protein